MSFQSPISSSRTSNIVFFPVSEGQWFSIKLFKFLKILWLQRGISGFRVKDLRDLRLMACMG